MCNITLFYLYWFNKKINNFGNLVAILDSSDNQVAIVYEDDNVVKSNIAINDINLSQTYSYAFTDDKLSKASLPYGKVETIEDDELSRLKKN